MITQKAVFCYSMELTAREQQQIPYKQTTLCLITEIISQLFPNGLCRVLTPLSRTNLHTVLIRNKMFIIFHHSSPSPSHKHPGRKLPLKILIAEECMWALTLHALSFWRTRTLVSAFFSHKLLLHSLILCLKFLQFTFSFKYCNVWAKRGSQGL